MSYSVVTPPGVPIRFYEENYVLNNGFGSPSFDQASHEDSVRANQVAEAYYKLVQTDDTVTLQFKRGTEGTTAWNFSKLYFLDEDGTVLHDIDPDMMLEHQGDKDKDTDDLLTTIQFFFLPSALSALNGKTVITLRVKHHFGDGSASGVGDTVRSFISDKILLAEKHDDTCKIEYTNTINKKGILFEQMRPTFVLRLPSFGLTYEPGGEHSVMTDQNGQNIVLFSQAVKYFNWDVGGFIGITESEFAILDELLTYDRVVINGLQYTRVEKEMNISGNAGRQLKHGSIKMQLEDERDSFVNSSYKSLILKRPASGYPYAFTNMYVTDGLRYISREVVVIDDLSAETTFKNSCNTDAALQGINSEFEWIGDELYIVNAPGERFKRQNQVFMYPTLLTLTVNLQSLAASVPFIYSLLFADTGGHFHVVSWGATAGDDQLMISGGSNIHTVSKTFGSTGTKTIRIFHYDNFNGFECYGNIATTDAYVQLTNVSGLISNITKTIRLTYHNFNALTTMSLSWIAPAKDTLEVLQINNSQVKGFTTGWASSLVNGSYKPFKLMRTISIERNKFTTLTVDAFLSHMVLNCYPATFGTLLINNNNPVAPPGSGGNGAKAVLVSRFWTVTTD